MSFMIGAVDRYESQVSSERTYREKYAAEKCFVCHENLVRPHELCAWRCRNGGCGIKTHITCMYSRIRNQVETTNVFIVGCPQCTTVLLPEEREQVMFGKIDEIDSKFKEVVEICETLTAETRTLKAENIELTADNVALKTENIVLKERVTRLETQVESDKNSFNETLQLMMKKIEELDARTS